MQSARRRLIGGAATVAVIGIGLSAVLASPASAAPKAPSWADVQAAKASASATQQQIDELTSTLSMLQEQADTASIAEQQAGQDYALAASKQQDAQTTVDDLAAQSKRAKTAADDSASQVAALVVELSRAGGGDLSTSMLTDAADAKDLLYRVGTMSHLSERSAGVLAQAQQDQRAVDSLKDQADAAKTALARATDRAESTLSAANDAASSAQSRLADEQSQQDTLIDQLAYLKGTSAATETAYWQAQQAKTAEAAIAKSPTKGATKASGTGSSSGTKTSGSTGSGTTTKPATGGSSGSTTTQPATGNTGSTTTQPATGSSSGSTGTTTPSKPSTPVTTTPTAPSSPSKGAAALAFATSQIGKPYVFGAAGPNSYDCSGLVMAAYASVGVAVGGHNVVWQYNYFAAQGRLVPLSQAQPGDILFYSTNGSVSGEYHNTLYAGGGMMVEAPKPGTNVRKISVWLPGQLMPYVARPTGSV